MTVMINGSFSQTSFRFRNDDGNQTSATWKEAVNVNATEVPFVTFRLRVLVQQTIADATQNLAKNFKIRASYNNGTYNDVAAIGATTSQIRYANSANVSDGAATTQQIGTGTFIAGSVDNNNDTGTITFTTSALSETELEFILMLYAPLMNVGDTIDLQVYETNNTALDVYTVTPRIRRKRRAITLR